MSCTPCRPPCRSPSRSPSRPAPLVARLCLCGALVLSALTPVLTLTPRPAVADEPAFSDVFRTHDAVMLLVDPDSGNIVDANMAAAAFYGYRIAELRTLRIQDLNMLTADEVRAEMRRAHDEARNHFIFQHRVADGSVHTVAVWSTPQQFDGRTLLLSIVADVTLFRSMNEAVWHYQGSLERDAERREAQLGLYQSEMRRQDRNTMIGMGIGIVVLLALSGWLVRDIRQRRATEAVLRQTIREKVAATEALAQFTEITAHHLQEPARRMGSFASLLRKRLMTAERPEAVLSLVDTIEAQAVRQRALVRDVQLYLAAGQAAPEQGDGDPTPLARKVAETLPERDGEAPVHVTIDALLPVPLAAKWLKHCLRLILDNAVTHSDPTRPLTIRIHSERGDGRTRLLISDNGPGIPKAYRERVFGVFERLHAAGSPEHTGVGLAIVRRIVETAGGQAMAHETPGGGTTIVLDFPDQDEEAIAP